MKRRAVAAVVLLATAACTAAATEEDAAPPPSVVEVYKRWPNGPNPTGDPAVFPINVWMQDPSALEGGVKLGDAYPEIGIDFGIGLWEDQWWYLRRDGLVQTDWRAYPDPKRVDEVLADKEHQRNYVGYLVVDEPDMNVAYGDQFHADMWPSAVLKKSNEVRAKDPSRPAFINFGVWMGTPGGGVGYGYIEKSYEEDMRTYCQAADIASADYYGWTHPDRNERVGAYTYGEVLDTMRKWCGPDKPLWGFVETGHPHDKGELITPDQLESAVWNTILHGATGINYFAHSFYTDGKGEYSSVLTRPEIKERVKAVNARLKALAPVLNAASVPGVSAKSRNDVPVSVLHKKASGARWVIAQTDGNATLPRSGKATVEITVPVSSGTATVVDENRTVPIVDGRIVDDFGPYQVHVYRF
ncbi:hypothetical protein GCM10022243_56280 [Saccharothrix violaceirubra]|uniref:Uncharacterized protein n=1 Tax=Saccharothrix violaceirubra TaxID=413306 RepID=A0A7W7T8B7_9PSEU|nr:hypothetical protein [Saccharothrix violaceirubra]MBB4967140.1 hypothetical protein [Saccharothrix violaceirubra]